MLLLALVSVAAAQQSVPGAVEPAVAEGKVVNAITGEPVAGALVKLRVQGSEKADLDGRQTGVAMETDDGGTFRFVKVKPGKYDLSVTKNGFLVANFGSRRPQGPGVPVKLESAQTASDLDMKLWPYAVITGTVTNDKGEPVSGCTVQASKRSLQRGTRQFMASGGQTDDAGNYRLSKLVAGRYLVQAICEHIYDQQRLQMVDREGNPIRTRNVPTFYGDAVSPEEAAVVATQLGQESTGINVRLHREAVYTISGKITDIPAGRSPQMYFVAVAGETGDSFAYSLAGRVQKDGSFEVTNVPPGKYRLVLFGQAEMGETGSVPVELDIADVKDIQVPVASAVYISGRVIVEGRPKAEMTGLTIQLRPEGQMFMNVGGATPAEDGSFKLGPVAASRYTVEVQMPAEDFYLQSVKLGNREVLDRKVDLRSSKGPLELVVSFNPAKVEGTVRRLDAESRQDVAAPAVNVALIPEIRTDDWSGGVKIGSTDKDGHFSIKSVPPGRYKAIAIDGIEYDQWSNPELTAALDTLTVPLEVKAGNAKQIDLKLVDADQTAQLLARLGL